MAPKAKAQKMNLGAFLGDQSLGSWADEMEDTPLPSSGSAYRPERTSYNSPSNQGGERSERETQYTDRGFSIREELPLPSKPPFTAHLGNLSFEVTQADVQDFLAACSVTSVRLVEDKMDRKPKGFGYVEFATLDGLKKALEFNGTQFQGRNIRVSVAEPPKDRQESRQIEDWTRRGPLPEISGQQRRDSDRGGYRQFDAPEGGERRRTPFEQGDGKVRDFQNWERKGPLSPSAAAPLPVRDGPSKSANTSFERKASPASWGEGRPEGEVRPAREFTERPPPVERQPTAAELDNKWRTNMKPDAPVPEPTTQASTPTSPVVPSAPVSRPRLNLQKRTVSEAPAAAEGNTTPSDSKASPFGAARAVDTAARDQQIAEKRLAQRAKQEEEAKAKEEKQKAERAEKAEKEKLAKVEKPQENGKPARSGGPKENGKESSKDGASAAAPRPTFEVLRRATDSGNGEAVNDGAVDAPANGEIVDDKSTLPQEVVRDIPTSGDSTNEASGTSAMEEDGWSTVTKMTKKSKGGNPGARAIAS